MADGNGAVARSSGHKTWQGLIGGSCMGIATFALQRRFDGLDVPMSFGIAISVGATRRCIACGGILGRVTSQVKTSGRVIVYRIFDVAEEIELDALREVGTRVRERQPAIVVRTAPLTIDLGEVDLRVAAQPLDATLVARVWQYGAVSLQFHLPIAAETSWSDLVQFGIAIEHDSDIESVALKRLGELRERLHFALRLPHTPTVAEDYTVYLLHSLDGASAATLAERADIPALLLGEANAALSAGTKHAILDSGIAYSEHDLAVVDWNSALIVDPAGGEDIADILEFANTHALEFRYYDDLLDARLERLYDQLRARRSSLLRREFERLSHEASALYLEVSEYVEQVENSLKFMGDLYLARVFRLAAQRFRLQDWELSIERKLGALVRTAELLHNEVNTRRSHLLEIIIILLILYEIVAAALHWT